MLAPVSATFVRAAGLGGLDELARARGVDFDELLQQQGVDPLWFSQPDNRMRFGQLVDLLDATAAATGDDCIGLHLGTVQSLRCAGILGYAAQASPDLRTLLTLASRYFRLHQDGATLNLQLDGKVATASYDVSDRAVIFHRQDSELTVALGVAHIRRLLGLANWVPSSVHFMHPRPQPASERELRRFFGCALHFEETFDGMRFPEAFLDIPIRTSDPGLLQILKSYAEDRLSLQDDTPSLVGNARRLVAANLANGRISIEDVAQALAMTPRTLQRRLADERVNFSNLVEETRRDMAVQYLRDRRLSLTDAAFLVGYSDLTAFHRAFRRWFNQTPLAYQRQLREQGDGLSSEDR
jgi:AraC-like DNA-binding protein